jgi:hypothetical protein
VTLETSFTGDPLFLPEGTDRIRAIIRDALPDARIKTYVYVRQVSEEIRKNGAWGRAAVSAPINLCSWHKPMRLSK